MTKDNKPTTPSVEVPASSNAIAEDNDNHTESLITFPTRFPIKAIGKNTPEFKQAVMDSVEKTIPKQDLLDVHEQLSSNEHYLSITVAATFYEQAGIDAVYMALTDEPLVIMAL